MIKALAAGSRQHDVCLVVNMVTSETEGRRVFDRMNRVSRTFLGRTLKYGGAVPADEAVREAIRHRVPFTLYAPDAPATRAVEALARSLLGMNPQPATGGGFFSRLATWLSAGCDSRESS